MNQPVLILVKICAALLTLSVFELIRRDKLKDQVAMVWLISSLTVLALTLWTPFWKRLAHTLGILYEPSLFFLAGILFCVGLLLYLAVVLSRHEREKEMLSQAVAISQSKIERLTRELETFSHGQRETGSRSAPVNAKES
ncbi:DUF2304 domain-containing protein [Candidatus Poribacteria bacterium]|nr:DUF2304 domain-containing protein [Candidatus Poribacteria bacterium]